MTPASRNTQGPWRWRTLLALCLGLATAPLFAADNEQARAILEKAIDSQRNPAELGRALEQIETLARDASPDRLIEYTRGWLLSHLGRKTESIAAYRRATVLDPSFSDAHYNLGIELIDQGEREEARKCFDEALRADPNHIDAAYNSGQVNYDLGRFDAALEKWRITQKLTPDDFQVARKVLQALNALGREEEAEVARQFVLRIKREKLDEAVRDVPEFCFDQLVTGAMRIYAYESFGQSPAIPVYLFKVERGRDGLIGKLEFVAGPGNGFTLRVSLPAGGNDQARAFDARPPWRELKPLVQAMVEARFGAAAK